MRYPPCRGLANSNAWINKTRVFGTYYFTGAVVPPPTIGFRGNCRFQKTLDDLALMSQQLVIEVSTTLQTLRRPFFLQPDSSAQGLVRPLMGPEPPFLPAVADERHSVGRSASNKSHLRHLLGAFGPLIVDTPCLWLQKSRPLDQFATQRANTAREGFLEN